MTRDVSPTVVMEHLVKRQKGILFFGDSIAYSGSETAREYFQST
jgi:hypothetical protein